MERSTVESGKVGSMEFGMTSSGDTGMTQYRVVERSDVSELGMSMGTHGYG